MKDLRTILGSLACLLALSLGAPGFAQEGEAPRADGSPTGSPAADAAAESDTAQPAARPKRAGDYRIRVKLLDPEGNPIGDTPVFLRAARPRGPFEPTAPEPVREWTELSNPTGVAVFDIVPQGLDGLRIHAVMSYDGHAYESAAVTPGDGVKLTIQAYQRTLDPDVLKIKSLRTVVQPWEEYLVFTQFYQLQNTSDLALDITAIPGEEFERGIPITLPVKAQGIRAMGPGENAVVDSTVFWRGFMRPGEVVNLQVRFSMSAREEEFVYEQKMEYDTEEVEVVVPLQTEFEKLPRLDTVSLVAPGFEGLGRTQDGQSPLDLRNDMEFLAAWENSVPEGGEFTFKVTGLPFEKPTAPWFFLILALVVSAGIVFYARKERERMKSEQGREDQRRALEFERESLLEQLAELEKQYHGGERSQAEYDALKLSLREQLAMVLKKLSDLEEEE